MREKLYRHLLHFGLIQLRNFFDASRRGADDFEAARCTAELLHYIPPLLMNSTSGPADVYFLEVGARDFLQLYPLKSQVHFLQTAELIFDLHSVINEANPVAWSFPNDVEKEVRKFKQAQNK